MSMLLMVNSLRVTGQAQLVMNGGVINITQGAYLVIDNPAPNAITINSGFIVSEGENNNVKWNIGITTGTYTIPWSYSGSYIPLTFTKTAGTGSGYFLFSTYHTSAQNSTLLPSGVTNINSTTGADNSFFASDRFWQMSALSYTIKPILSNVVFTYLDAENISPNTITESELRADRYNNTLNSWTDNILSSTINTTSNTVTVSSVDAANLYSWWAIGNLGTKRYWVAPSNSTSNLAANWSGTSGGTGGAGVPTAQDDVIFDGAANANTAINANLTAMTLLMSSGYSGTITQGTSIITLSSTATFSGGTFTGGSSGIIVGGAFTLSGTSFTSSTATLDLKSNFTFNSGSFAHNSGTVKFSGTTATQNINGSVAGNFNNILVTNVGASPGVSVQSNQNLLGVLTLASNVVFDADGSSNTSVFKLISSNDNPTQDAAVDVLPSGAQVTGNVTVQRFMAKEGPNNNRIYRYISSPVQNASVADIQNEIPVTGSFTGTSVCSGCLTNQSMFSYNETVITDTNGNGIANLFDGYIDFPGTSNTETLVPGLGYTIYVRGNILGSTLWDVRGPVNAGNVTPVSLPVTFTSSGSLANDGWNLVGNPFPSTIDWSAASGWTKTNLDASIYITDNGNPTIQYATWNGVTGTNGGSRYIATGQGFWTKANGSGAPVLQANENTKAAGTQTIFFREGSLTNLLRVTMIGGITRDETVLHFRDDATPGFDHHADALKWMNESFSFFSLSSNNEMLAINSWSALGCGATPVKLSVTNAGAGHYSLKFSNLDSFEETQLTLSDHFLNQSISITDNMVYPFDVTTDVHSTGSDRFLLTINRILPPVVIGNINDILTIDYTTNVQWYYNDELIAGATSPTFTPKKSGTYSVVVIHSGCELTGSIVFAITGLEKSLPEGINVFPNPVTNVIFITADKNEITSITVINALGETLGEFQLTDVNGYQSGSFAMQDKAAGIYLLRIVAGKNIYSKKIIKK